MVIAMLGDEIFEDGRMILSPTLAGLTLKEIKVAKLVGKGKSRKEVAKAARIAFGTVNSHMSNIFIKTGVSTKSELVAYCFHYGLLVPLRTRG